MSIDLNQLPHTLPDLNSWEEGLVDNFIAHPIFKALIDPKQMTRKSFENLLLQRSFISYDGFTPIADRVEARLKIPENQGGC